MSVFPTSFEVESFLVKAGSAAKHSSGVGHMANAMQWGLVNLSQTILLHLLVASRHHKELHYVTRGMEV
jgi:hypothetical protein